MCRSSYSIFLSLIFSVLGFFLVSCGGGGTSSPGGFCRVEGGSGCSLDRESPVALLVTQRASGRIFTCSATFVTLDDALTAAHCFPHDTIDAVITTDGEDVFQVNRGRVHPLYAGGYIGDSSPDASPYDVAMITIEGVRNIAPAPLIITRALMVGDEVTALGFGTDDGGTSLADREVGEKLRATKLSVDSIEPLGRAFSSASNRASICPGDSGGPATLEVDGATGIVGVASFGLFFSGSACARESIGAWGSVQDPDIFNFILNYASDVATL